MREKFSIKGPALNLTQETIQKRLKLSSTLLKFAWLVEIFAVATGLFIALMVGIDTLTQIVGIRGPDATPNSSDYINTTISVLPFILVAIVELTKIPVTQAVYNTKKISWRLLFLSLLAFLAVITFETSINGLERNFANLTYEIDKYRDDLEVTNENIEELERQRQEAAALTLEKIERDFSDRQRLINEQESVESSKITEQIIAIRSKVNNNTIKDLSY